MASVRGILAILTKILAFLAMFAALLQLQQISPQTRLLAELPDLAQTIQTDVHLQAAVVVLHLQAAVVVLHLVAAHPLRSSIRLIPLVEEVQGILAFNLLLAALNTVQLLYHLCNLLTMPFYFLGWCGSTAAYCGAGTQSQWAFSPSSPSSGGSSTSSSSNTLVPAWSDCKLGVDTCVSGFQCCVAVADRSTNKATCRQSGLVVNDPNGCSNEPNPPAPSVTTSSSQSSTSTTPAVPSIVVPAWSDCKLGVDTCVSGFQCCVAVAGRSTNKATCRQAGLVANDPNGCSTQHHPVFLL